MYHKHWMNVPGSEDNCRIQIHTLMGNPRDLVEDFKQSEIYCEVTF